ncbi:MAG: aminoglycoside phosphotransferase family protein, partial [Methylococcaceae bacterium]|nr:aminoglycoside phosphotransferase family protein [Methylococcaceae bacterium]
MTTQLQKNQRNNLRFLIVEVGTQIANLQDYITSEGASSIASSFNRSGYIHNLKIRLHNDGYQQRLKAGNKESDAVAFRSIDNIANNLERIAELCLDCTHHDAYLHNDNFSFANEYMQLLDRVALGISLIERANQNNNSQQALKIAEIQQKLSDYCEQLINKYSQALKTQQHTDHLIAALFVLKSIKSMGDALLKICDATLSRHLGQTISVERYYSLSRCVEHLHKNGASKNLVLDTLAETRSGSAISGVSEANKEDIIAIFKEGKKQKLKEECQSVERWHKIYPGIAPRILSYQKQGQSAALLIEHLAGNTFENILLQGSDKLQKKSLEQLTLTLSDIWQKTQRKNPVNAQYMQQLQKRIPDVYTIHPSFQQQHAYIAGISIPAFSKLLQQAHQLEQTLAAPFSVYIHGDFNTDNIIYDSQHNKINFIDLHRSCYMDYVQDISVFMVSNYRLKALNQKHQQRVLQVNLAIYQFAAEFARHHKDDTFELRLALGL